MDLDLEPVCPSVNPKRKQRHRFRLIHLRLVLQRRQHRHWGDSEHHFHRVSRTLSNQPSWISYLNFKLTAFGKPAATGFGTFGQPQQLTQQQPVQLSPDDAFAQSVLNVSIFGDERDTVIAKWNYLQALWGKGKAYYSQNAPPVEITPQNFLCRFKAIGYNKMPGKENKLGLVALVFNKPESQIR